ncbi:hypothetical protein N7519_009322 [Penicillium mononematosum]|uniref:uncharacterized protein n=1 Tax=Penicillium mononematosum TaxID=268346 RepID=UPI0025478E9E|nr:uncharacterized protein N7519_009322 [Penicillium mononematosum]KAJ6178861.1 hypothetical protein N7519_009322 [Penicillium mononematosum]
MPRTLRVIPHAIPMEDICREMPPVDWAVPIKPEDGYKAAVTTPHGQYAYRRMGMGMGLKTEMSTYAQFYHHAAEHRPRWTSPTKDIRTVMGQFDHTILQDCDDIDSVSQAAWVASQQSRTLDTPQARAIIRISRRLERAPGIGNETHINA